MLLSLLCFFVAIFLLAQGEDKQRGAAFIVCRLLVDGCEC
jgi:hypothetical protein